MKKLDVAKEVLKKLLSHGYVAYIVGGFVRDRLLNIQSDDIDIATSAKPLEVMNLFQDHIPTGLKHGTVTIKQEGFLYEVTTFREEKQYVDHRRPDEVHFIKSFKGDLLRRDFTINALAMDINEEIIDYVEGMKDLEQGLIRAVGASFEERFEEDALRILRALRFQSRLGFDIENMTFHAMCSKVQLLESISHERIMKELTGILAGRYAKKAFHNMVQSSVHQYIPYMTSGIEKVISHDYIPKNMIELIAICLVTDGFELLDRLNVSKNIKSISKLAAEMHIVGITDFSPVYLFRNGLESCLIANRLNVIFSNTADESRTIKNHYLNLPIKKICDLEFKGDDLIALYDREPGPWIGQLIDEICYKVLMRELQNDKQEIKNYLLSK